MVDVAVNNFVFQVQYLISIAGYIDIQIINNTMNNTCN